MSVRPFPSLVLIVLLTGCDATDVVVHDRYAQVGATPSAIATSATAPNAAQVAKPAGDVKLDLMNVEEIQKLVASKKGKVVVMDAWSTYCDPCMEAFPGLVGLHKKYGPEKLACISLNMNYAGLGKVEEETDSVIGFLRKQGATFDNILCTEEDLIASKKMNFKSVPAIFIYDRDGKLVKLINTETTYAEVEKIVTPLLP